MAKGRPPLNPRIEALEKHYDRFSGHLGASEDRLAILEGKVAQLAELVEWMRRNYVSRETTAYKPLFDHWPGMR